MRLAWRVLEGADTLPAPGTVQQNLPKSRSVRTVRRQRRRYRTADLESADRHGFALAPSNAARILRHQVPGLSPRNSNRGRLRSPLSRGCHRTLADLAELAWQLQRWGRAVPKLHAFSVTGAPFAKATTSNRAISRASLLRQLAQLPSLICDLCRRPIRVMNRPEHLQQCCSAFRPEADIAQRKYDFCWGP